MNLPNSCCRAISAAAVCLIFQAAWMVSANSGVPFDSFGGMPSSSVDDHIREKRMAAGTAPEDTKFTLTRTSGSDSPMIGDVLYYRLDILLPKLSTAMNLTVLISSRIPGDRDQQVGLALCKPVVASVGDMITSASNKVLTATKPTMNYNARLPQVNDKAILDFGPVLNSDTSTNGGDNSSLISITFCAGLVDSSTNATPVYLSSSAEYASGSYIWVGQDQLTPSYANRNNDYPAEMTLATGTQGTATVNPGSSASFLMDAAIIYPWIPLNFGAVVYDTTEYVSLGFVGASFPSTGFYAQNNPERALTYIEQSNYRGNVIAREAQYGPLLNMHGSNNATTDAGNKIQVALSICLSPDAPPGKSFYAGAYTSINEGGQGAKVLTSNFTVTAGSSVEQRTAANKATFLADGAVSTLSATNVAPPGGSVIFLAKMTVASPGWFTYTLTVTPPVGFQGCNARMDFYGGNIGCVPQLDKTYVTIDNASGVLKVDFVAKQNGMATTDPVQNQIWVAVTVTGGSASGSVQFKDTDLATRSMDIVMDSTSLSATTPAVEIRSSFEYKKWYVGGQIGYTAFMVLPGNYPLENAVFQASGDPARTSGFGVRICKVELSFAGRGVGCLSTNNRPTATYKKSANSSYDDMATMPLGSFCYSTLDVASPFDQILTVRVAAELPHQQSITAAVNYTMSAGVLLTGSQIWVGLIQFQVQPYTVATPDGDDDPTSSATVTSYFADQLQIGGTARIPYVVKIPPEKTNLYTLKIFSNDTGVSICSLTIKGIGSNFPCMDPNPFGKWGPEQKTRLTYTKRNEKAPTLGNSEAILEFGILTNLGSEPLFAGRGADPTGIAVEALVSTASNASGTVSLTAVLSWIGLYSPHKTTLTSTLSTKVAPALSSAYSLTIVDRDTRVVGGYVPGVAKKIDVDITPTSPNADLVGHEVAILLENTNPAGEPYNICCAALSYVGSNYPCINHTGFGYTTTTTNLPDGSKIISSLLFKVGDVCYSPIYTPDGNSTRLTVEAYISVGTYNGTFNSPVNLKATLVLTNVNTAITALGTIQKTSASSMVVGTAGGSVDLLTSPNVSGSSVPGTPPTLRARQRGIVAYNVCVPANELVSFEPGVMVADSDTRARATVVKATIQKTGQNIACMSAAYQTDFYSGSNLTSAMQKDQAYIKTYYVRNTGITRRSGTWQPDDDCMQLWVEIEVTDHPLNSHNSSIKVVLGAAIGSVIEVETHAVTVVRPDAAEAADISVTLSVLNGVSTTIYNPNDLVPLGIVACHTATSNREAVDPLIRVVYPPYMDYNANQVVSHNSTYNLVAVRQGPYVVFKVPYLLFADGCIQLNFTLTVNPNMTETPQSSSSGVDAATMARVVCKMPQFASPTAMNPNSTGYYHCGGTAAVNYLVKAVGCSSVALGMESKQIQDCQITASTAALNSTPPQKARPGVDGYWSPALNSFEPYLEILFGNVAEISSISFTTDTNGADVTGYRIMTSFDGVAFADVETATASPYVPVGGPFTARFLRFVITSTSSSTKLVGLKLEPRGCYRSTDLTNVSDTCAYAQPARYTDDIKSWRHVVVDTDNKVVYFCVYHTVKQRTLCFSGASEGSIWQPCPGYIGYFAGVDTSTTPDRVIGVDVEGAAYVYSDDGIAWTPLSAADYAAATSAAASFVKSTPVPSHPSLDAAVNVVGAGGWTVDNTGVSFNGARKVVWGTCCN